MDSGSVVITIRPFKGRTSRWGGVCNLCGALAAQISKAQAQLAAADHAEQVHGRWDAIVRTPR